MRSRLDALPPQTDDGGRDDLHDVGLVRVVRTEALAALLAQYALHERPENGGVDRLPVELGRLSQVHKLIVIHEHRRGPGEQVAVHITRAGIAALAIVVALLVEQGEEVADVACRIRVLLL